MSRSGQRGFTLLEVLTALTITALGLTLISRMLFLSAHAEQNTRSLPEAALFLESVMETEALNLNRSDDMRRTWIESARNKGWNLTIHRKPEPEEPDLDRIDLTLTGNHIPYPLTLTRWVRHKP